MNTTKYLVVYDPTTDKQPALERAAYIAASSTEGIRIHVFSCIYTKLSKSPDIAAEIKRLVAAQQQILDAAVAPLIENGIEVTTQIQWEEDWYGAVVRATKSHAVDAVIKSSHKHSPTQRLLKKTSDWTIIRECHCPVLLAKAEITGNAKKVLAAVDNRGGDETRDRLNRTILESCAPYQNREDIEIHFVSAFDNLESRPDRGSMIRACGVPGEQVHIRMGDPSKVIVDIARELQVGSVIIGNSARSGLAAVLNANTVEKILDDLDCDLFALPG